jgi:hypothetical protein
MASDRHIAFRLAALALLAAAAAPAAATLFVCTDPRGRTITSDRPPPECADVPIRELRADGSVRRVIEPPLSEEQRRERAEKSRREYLEREAKRSQARRDVALMETYASEAEIEAARQTALATRQTLIDRAKQRLDAFAVERKKLDSETEFYANRKLPEKLERAIESNKELVAAERRLIAEMQADMARINERFDAEADRFRELVQGGTKPARAGGQR